MTPKDYYALPSQSKILAVADRHGERWRKYMKIKNAYSCVAWSFILFLAFGTISTAQERRKTKKTDIPTLINKLEDEREFDTKEASNALIKIGTKVILPLIESLKRKKGCEFQFHAAEVIRKLDPKQEIVKSTLFDVARGRCEYRYPPEKYLPDANLGSVLSMFYAATILATEIEGGIPLVTELLKGNGIVSAAYAFVRLMEMLENKRQDKIPVKQEVINDIKAAIPMLVKALDIKREKLRCDFYDILEYLKKSGYEELSVEANRAMQGITVRCPE